MLEAKCFPTEENQTRGVINTNKTRDLWTELKKMNKINSKTVNSLDSHDDEKDIAEHLAGKYHAIFSCARTDDAVLDKLKQTIDDSAQ